MKTVLLLDDDEDLRALLRSALVAHGLEVLEAGAGAEADDALGRHPVDLIVVDGVLPDGPGLAFIERLRARDRGIRIVFLSTLYRDLKTFRRLTRELDVSLVVYKPVDPTTFAAKLMELAEPGEGVTRSVPPESSGASDLARELGELRRQFTEKLPHKLEELESAVRDARTDAARLGDARMFAHRLRGSAGSYGHAAVGELVGVVEDLLNEALSSGSGRRFFWEEVAGAVRDARLAIARAPESSRSGEIAQAPSKALLVVDDDRDFLQMVRLIARKMLVDVVTAQSFDEALQRASAQPLVAAILDVHLCEEDSYLLARKIRETEGNSEIAIAFASVDRRIETRVAAIEAGGTKFFEKPISEESFGEIVQQLLRLSQTQQGRVLIVDDDLDALAHYSLHLRAAGYFVEQLPSADTLVDKLDEVRPDVLLLDVNLPRVSGIDVCRALRMSERWELLPILIVTAQVDAGTRLRAFRGGASDVIAKPVLPEELLARVGVQVERTRLLRDRADKDPLSGLWLRRAFAEAFQRSLALCTREQKSLALVLLDIDEFKKVNDRYGHLVGDKVIQGLGELLRRRFRVEDLRGRWGGEEFVLVFPGQGEDFAVQATRRLLAEFRELPFSGEDGQLFVAAFTAGVATFPGDGTSLSALIRCADERLYAGKSEGRSRVKGSFPPPSSGPGSHAAGVEEKVP